MKVKAVFPLMAGLLVGFASSLKAELLPVEYFFKNPTFRRVRLSPDGTHLAVLVRFDENLDLAVIDLADNTPRRITHSEDIRGPVFIYHGVRDLNVDIKQSRIRVYGKIDEFLTPFRQKWGLDE